MSTRAPKQAPSTESDAHLKLVNASFTDYEVLSIALANMLRPAVSGRHGGSASREDAALLALHLVRKTAVLRQRLCAGELLLELKAEVAGPGSLGPSLEDTLRLLGQVLRRDGEIAAQLRFESFTALVLMALAKTDRCWPSPPTRTALLAAMSARNAAIEGDGAAVDAFSRTWLGLSQPERWREAVEMALLGDWVLALGDGSASDPAVIRMLSQHTSVAHRQLQPLWERRIRGKRVALLSTPVGQDQTLGDLLTNPRSAENVALSGTYSDGRLAVVLRGLRREEAGVATGWAHTGATWERAAADQRLPAAYGERVRRKLKRLGAQHTGRAAAAVRERRPA
ncbi:hypothetical protein [Streptomyces chrestomyceticus]|uniref:hypothetical protein n=1 Tax=Streptomyces chrestomyceticus TaxID=68185 RepID=UPI0033FE7AB4